MNFHSIKNQSEISSHHLAQCELSRLIFEANQLSISAHNTQPFYFQKQNEFEFSVYYQSSRDLLVGDPTHKDLKVSFGAFLFALETLCDCKNVSVKYVPSSAFENGHIGIIQFNIQKTSQINIDQCTKSYEKYEKLKARFSYRGVFLKNNIFDENIKSRIKEVNENIYVLNSDEKTDLAEMYDKINMTYLSDKKYLAELYSWLRFTITHSRWSSDGLNSESMALSNIESVGAKFILMPSIFSILNNVGIAKYIVSEKSKIENHSILVAIATKNSDPISWGKLFLSVWSEATALGLYGNPLSLLTDSADHRDEIYEKFHIHKDLHLVNILRLGYLPNNYKRYSPARLKISELIGHDLASES